MNLDHAVGSKPRIYKASSQRIAPDYWAKPKVVARSFDRCIVCLCEVKRNAVDTWFSTNPSWIQSGQIREPIFQKALVHPCCERIFWGYSCECRALNLFGRFELRGLG